MNFKRVITSFDYVLMGIVLIIFGLGMLAIASATDVMNFGITRQVQMQALSFIIGQIGRASWRERV